MHFDFCFPHQHSISIFDWRRDFISVFIGAGENKNIGLADKEVVKTFRIFLKQTSVKYYFYYNLYSVGSSKVGYVVSQAYPK